MDTIRYTHTYVVGTYKDEEPLFKAISTLQKAGIIIDEVYTPYPVHGLDKALKMKDSRLHIGGFIYGLIGLTIALSFMSWVMLSDWPVNYGGKPFWSFPAFVPILFEFTVLCAAVGMVLTFLYTCRLSPFVKRHRFNARSTDDTFVVVVKTEETGEQSSKEVMDKFKKLDPLSLEMQEASPKWWFGSY